MPGIYVLTQSNTVKVDLQDYNDQVLQLVTLPNILLNTCLRPDQQPARDEVEEEEEEEEDNKEEKDPDDDDEDEEDADVQETDPADGDFRGVEIDLPDTATGKLDLVKSVETHTKLFMGDWSGLVDLMAFKDEADKYDLILTSETIYSEESQPKLYATIKNSLKLGGKA